jgi:hypothetical protein
MGDAYLSQAVLIVRIRSRGERSRTMLLRGAKDNKMPYLKAGAIPGEAGFALVPNGGSMPPMPLCSTRAAG